MSEWNARIQKRLRRSRLRERGILLGQAFLQCSAVVLTILALASLAYSQGGGREEIRDGLGALGLAGLLLGLSLPLVLRWRGAADLRAQARRIEVLEPAMGHRLVTSMDRSEVGEGAKPVPENVSRVLLDRVSKQAAEILDRIPPNRVHPWRPLGWPGAAAGVSLALCVLSSLFFEVGPLQALEFAIRDRPILERIQSLSPEVVVEEALVGDIVLRYSYPDYTGLSVLEVNNSDGTIHGPEGTRVAFKARTAEVFEYAYLEIGSAEPVALSLAGGRDISGQLRIEESGTWRILLFRGEDVFSSPTYPIILEMDTPPVVTLQTPGRDVQPMDQPLEFSWSVQDDFGIESVLLEVERSDGSLGTHLLRRPEDPNRQLSGSVRFTPSELGLKPGERVKLRVVSYDNDQARGHKRGESMTVEMSIGSSSGRGPKLLAYHRRLRDALVPVLADFLEEQAPPFTGTAEMNGWASAISKRFDPIQDIYEKQWGSVGSDRLDAELIGEVLARASRLSRYVITTWDPSSPRRVTAEDITTLQTLHTETITSLEMAIFIIDRVLKQVALAEVVEKAEQLAAEAQELAAMPDDLTAGEMLARLDQLERLLSALQESASELSDSGLEEFINSRSSETQNLMNQVRKAIAEGRMEDAGELMDQLAEQVQQLAESVADQFAQQQQGEDQLQEAYEQLQQDLEQLAAEQETLAGELEEARKELGSELQEKMDRWRELDELAQSALGSSQATLRAAGHGQGWRASSIRDLEDLHQQVESVQEAIRARDVDSAVIETMSSLAKAWKSTRAVEHELSRPRPSSEAVPGGVGEAVREIEKIKEDLEAIDAILQELQTSSAMEPPELQELAKDMSSQQDQLQQRQQKLSQDLKRVEQALPTADGSASKSMNEGGQAMQRASRSLQRGESMPGEDHQLDAARHIRDAKDRLEKQMQQAAEMQRLRQQMQQGGDGGGRPGNGEEHLSSKDFSLPVPEAFQTPEEYRRALLEGMEADVPEEYRALNQRYFEELVRQ